MHILYSRKLRINSAVSETVPLRLDGVLPDDDATPGGTRKGPGSNRCHSRQEQVANNG